MTYLSRHPTQNMYGRELVGDVGPHILISRTADERIDTSVIQLTNTLLPFGLGYGLDKLYNKLQPLMNPLKTDLQHQWFGLGKSLALFAALTAVPIANAFIRSWVTLKRTGKDSFINMVGETSSENEKATHQSAKQNKLNQYRNRILGIWAAGAVASATIFGITQSLIRKAPQMGTIAKTLTEHLGLKDGKFEFFGGPKRLPRVLFWGIPIYAGLFAASRDEFEFKELVLRFGAFLLAFFELPNWVKKQAEKRAPKSMIRMLGSKANFGVVAEFIATTIGFATIPPLINIFLTHQRALKAGINEASVASSFNANGAIPVNSQITHIPSAFKPYLKTMTAA